MKRILLLTALAVVMFACSKNAHEAEPQRTIVVDDIPKEIRIPSAVWDRLEGKAAHGAHGGEGEHGAPAAGGGGDHGGGSGGASAEEEDLNSGALFMPVTVTLIEKNPGVLSESPLTIRLPRGGGTIDLAPFMTGTEGSFHVRFEWPEREETDEFQSWFVSKARRRKLGDELWGAGCGRFYRVTQALEKTMKSGGLTVNTTRNRHLTVLGGHFIFSAKRKGQLFLTQVTFKDSRFENLYCEEL
ncbi:MAG: hypothetical protein KF802_06140 [Bdellovibrionaceae bacterium]|nr:hypothetical protein [Pseudobdellovibrionaceae bacterium]MBX3032501.1 hypothetical protein [Pseudobdellovibrionaceae bacterium]